MLKYWSGSRLKALQQCFLNSRTEILLQQFTWPWRPMCTRAEQSLSLCCSHPSSPVLPGTHLVSSSEGSVKGREQPRWSCFMWALFGTFIFQLSLTHAYYMFINGSMPPYTFIKSYFSVAFECTPHNGKLDSKYLLFWFTSFCLRRYKPFIFISYIIASKFLKYACKILDSAVLHTTSRNGKSFSICFVWGFKEWVFLLCLQK